MIEKNKRKQELKERRKPPIPYSRKTKTKREKEIQQERRWKYVGADV